MATRSLGTLTLDLIAKIGGFTGPLDKASRHTKKSMSSVEGYARKASLALGAASAAFVATSAVMIKSQINIADEMSKSSAVVGIAIEDLSGLRHAADLSGVSFDQLESGLNKFNKVTAEAVEGVGAGADAYKKLGVELHRADGSLKNNYELIEDLSDAFSGMQNGAQKSALAQELFGRSGAKLIPLLNGGKQGLKAFADEAERLGLVISAETGKYSEEFNDNLSRLQQTMTGLARRVAGEAVPALAEFTNTFADPEFQSNLADVASGIVKIGSAAVDAVRELMVFGSVLGEELARITNGIDAFNLTDVYDQIEKVKSAIQNPSERIRFFGKNGLVEYFNEGELQAELEKLIAQRDYLLKNNPAPELFKSNPKTAEKAAEVVESISGVYEKMSAEISKQISLIDKSTKSAQIEYEVRNGLIKGLLAGEGELLIAQQKRLDAAELAYKRESDLIAAADERSQDIVNVITGLKDEVLALEKGESAWLAYQLQLEGATPAEIEQAVALKARAQALRNTAGALEDLMSASGLFAVSGAKDAKFVESAYTKAAERIDATFASAWQNMDGGFEELRDGIVGSFKTMLAEMAHEALTKPIVMNIQQSMTGGAGSAIGAAGAGGLYAAGALAVVAAVSIWSKSQDEKFLKMTSEYRQGVQSLGTILGEQNKKSESIASLTDMLAGTASDTLNVNYEMWRTLIDIRTGIAGVSSGFAKTIIGSGDFSGLGEENSTLNENGQKALGLAVGGGFYAVSQLIGGEIGGFFDSVIGSISKAIYSKKKKVIDAGIEFTGQTLAGILESGVVDAFAYADVQTKKKFLGITSSNKLRRSTEDLDDIFLGQFADVFSGAADALDQAATIFGLDFDKYIGKLTLPAQSLSLKDLEGEALTAEIESFFSSTLDNWAGVLVDGSMVLEQFQKIGEGAFETVLRLASETATFADYAAKLGLTFDAIGFDAVNATQEMAELAGGFDQLGNSLAAYADKFFSDSEKFLNIQAAIGEAFAELGVALPQSREQFRALVEGIDLATAAGREQFTSLMQLTNATDSYLDALEREQKVNEEALRSAVGDAFKGFTSAIEREMGVVDDALSASQGVADSLTGALRGMRLESIRGDLLNRRAAQAQLITANAISRAGGPLPGAGELDAALNVLAEPSQQLFATFEEYAKDFYTTSKNIKELEAAAGEQVSIHEQNLTALEESLSYYQKEIDLLDGIDVGVLSVRDAIENLTHALVGAGSTTVTRTPMLPVLSDDYENQRVARTTSIANESQSAVAKRGNFSDLGGEDQSELLALVKQLVDGLEVSQLAIAKNTNKASKLLERWDIDGIPAERV